MGHGAFFFVNCKNSGAALGRPFCFVWDEILRSLGFLRNVDAGANSTACMMQARMKLGFALPMNGLGGVRVG
jgi:hypothetical protein